MNLAGLVQASKLSQKLGNRAQERKTKRKEMLERRKEERAAATVPVPEVAEAVDKPEERQEGASAWGAMKTNMTTLKWLTGSVEDLNKMDHDEVKESRPPSGEPAAEPSPTRSGQAKISLSEPEEPLKHDGGEIKEEESFFSGMMGGLMGAAMAPAEEEAKADNASETENAADDVAVKPDSDIEVEGQWETSRPASLPKGCVVLPNYRQMWSDVVFTRAKTSVQSTSFDKQAVSRLSWGSLCRDRGGDDPWAVIDGRSLDKQLQWRLRESETPGLGQHQEAGPPETRIGAVPSTPYLILSKGIEHPPEFPKMPAEPIKCNYDRWTGDLKISEVKRVDEMFKELKQHRDMLHNTCERWIKQAPQSADAKPPTPDFVSPFVKPEMYCDKKTGSVKKPKLTTCPTEASKAQRKSILGQISAVRMKIMVERAQGLPETGLAGGIYPYVVVLVVDGDPLTSAGAEKEQWKGETEAKETTDPVWEQELLTEDVKVRKKTHLHFMVVDAGIAGASAGALVDTSAIVAHTLVGQAAIPLSQVIRGGWGDIKALALAPMVGEDGKPEDRWDLKESRIFVKVGWETVDYKGGAVKLQGATFADVSHATSSRLKAAKGRAERRRNRLGENSRKSMRGSLRRASLKGDKRASVPGGPPADSTGFM